MIAVMVAYLVLLAGIGVWSATRSRHLADFYLAGRRLGLFAMVCATMSSIMSGFVFVGGPGLFYSTGLGSFWIVISSSFTGALICWLLARPLYHLAHTGGCVTVPDVILSRYGCRFSSGLAAFAIALGVIGYLGTQLIALGLIVGTVLDTPFWLGLLIGTLVLVFYSTAGGMVAAVYTDIVQGAVMLAATVTVFGFTLSSGGGLSHLAGVVMSRQPEVLSPWGLVGPTTCLGWFFLFAVGSLGQPHVIHKFMMVRDLSSIRHLPWILACCMIACSLVWLGVGLSTKSLALEGHLAPLAHADDAVGVFLTTQAPSWLAALLYAGVISAIMSTADSFANVGVAAIARDVPKMLGREPGSGLISARICSLLLFAAAAVLGLTIDSLVAYVGILGFGLFAAALTPLLALGLNWPEASRWSARVSVVVGSLGLLLFEILSKAGVYRFAFPPAALALVLSFLVFVAVALAGRQLAAR